MNLSSSWKALHEVWRDDVAFRRLGCSFGWYVGFHYRGRWRDRIGRPHPWERLALTVRNRRIEFELSSVYAGALKGVFLDDEYDCTARLTTAPLTILDLGANIGFGAIYLHGLFPEAKVALLEPDPRNLARLHDNLERNRIKARIFGAAIGPSPGELALLYGADPTCSTLASTGMHRNSNAVAVRVMTIPEVLAELSWTYIDLLKIDIEGAEDMLLERDSHWLNKVGALLIEIHPNTTAERIQRHLRPHGFMLQRLRNGREPVYFAGRQS